MADWITTLDGLPGLSAVEKGKARVLLLRKSQEDASLLVSGVPDVAAEAIKEILRQEASAAGLGVGSAAGTGATAGLGVGSAAGAGPKRVVVVIVDKLLDEPPLQRTMDFTDQKDLRDYVKRLNAAGLIKLEDVGGSAPQAIKDFDKLEDGETYLLDMDGSSTISMRRYTSSIPKAQENEMTQAVERDVKKEDPTSTSQPHLRILKDSSGGRDEMEVDCVILGKNTAFVRSHKSTFTGPSMVKEIADKASTIERKSVLPEYASTSYASFQGKRAVPVFMAENVEPEKFDILRESCRAKGVKLYRRTGNAIRVWACTKQQLTRGAVASRGAMRRVL
ncbi:hypothetical protein HXX76_013298 [Chlamydomonas incerta]|uniref:Uncharacterized protein n=1 Tax=Chlamydomonas incerta TaxID=51695 RepID=A0A835VUG1_CHLIN|nr:hypothetical protein HXX76_013298 [Chlamydomonas incerta]|eukprot:KAG2425924.1 hypothetical protein HXX76_013298 [Chlamydomonas incerta]